jgi:hypothetical protein
MIGILTRGVATQQYLLNSSQDIENNLLTGLVTYYSFENNLEDSVGNYDLSASSAISYTPSKIDQGPIFDGSSWMSGSNGYNEITGSFTISVWIYSDIDYNTGGDYKSILAKYYTPTDDRSYALVVRETDKLRLRISEDGDLTNEVVSSESLVKETWYHVVAVFDAGNEMRLYINNGSPVSESTSLNSIHSSSEPLYIGQVTRNTGNYLFDGIIDEIGVWNRVLTEEEISLLYNSGSGLSYNNFD